MKAKMSKKSSITITVMACLLAVAVATTIVLAAFSANKTATTTITFSNGVQLQITGATKQTNQTGDPDVYSTSAELFWNVILANNSSAPDQTGSVGGTNGLDGSQQVDLAAISIDVKGSGNAQIYLAVKPAVTWAITDPASNGTVDLNDSEAYSSQLTTNGWTAGSDGYYLKTVTLSKGVSTGNAFCGVTNLYTPATTGTDAEKAAHDNAYAGRVYTANIIFEASTTPIHVAAATP